jgi:hypothetical protein
VAVLLAADKVGVLVDDALHAGTRQVPAVFAVFGEATHCRSFPVASLAADPPASQASRTDAGEDSLARRVVSLRRPARALVVYPCVMSLVHLDQRELPETVVCPPQEAHRRRIDPGLTRQS